MTRSPTIQHCHSSLLASLYRCWTFSTPSRSTATAYIPALRTALESRPRPSSSSSNCWYSDSKIKTINICYPKIHQKPTVVSLILFHHTNNTTRFSTLPSTGREGSCLVVLFVLEWILLVFLRRPLLVTDRHLDHLLWNPRQSAVYRQRGSSSPTSTALLIASLTRRSALATVFRKLV